MIIPECGKLELQILRMGLKRRLSEFLNFRKIVNSKIVHTQQKIGCVILQALEQGKIDTDSYENYQKMEREKEHFESTVAEKRKKDKDLRKLIKRHKKLKKC